MSGIRGPLRRKHLDELEKFLSKYGYERVNIKGEYEVRRFISKKHDPIVVFRKNNDDFDDDQVVTVQKIDGPMIKAFFKWRKENADVSSI